LSGQPKLQLIIVECLCCQRWRYDGELGYTVQGHPNFNLWAVMKNRRQFHLISIRLSGIIVLLSWLFLSCPAQVWGAPASGLNLRLSSTTLFQGDAALVSVAPADFVASARVIMGEKEIPLVRLADKDIFAAFIAIPKDEKAGPKDLRIMVVDVDGKRSNQTLTFNVKRKEFPVQHLTLPKEKVTLSKKDLARHRREKTAVNKALASPFADRVWQSSFSRPVAGVVSTPFGVRRLLNGKPRSSHSGIDFRGRKGEPVAVSSDGVVVLTGEHFFAGKSVYVDHGMGIATMYFHLSAIQVKKGDRVKAGQVIGLVGSTGRSTGPHLHWGLRIHNRPADPLSLLALFPLR
jgi:murein DD-endopeptidase MepM/ murein hydrolase activator NlpD